MKLRLLYTSLAALLFSLSVLCGAYMLVSYDMSGTSSQWVGYFLGICWMGYLLAALLAVGLLFDKASVRIASKVTPWQGVVGLAVLGVIATFPITLATGTSDNPVVVALTVLLLGIVPIGLALFAEQSNIFPRRLDGGLAAGRHDRLMGGEPVAEGSTEKENAPSGTSSN
jgi:hypothetical protein